MSFQLIYRCVYIFFLMLVQSITLNGQESNTINWLSFEQLEDSLKVSPKKVFIYFHADWCSLCVKMNATTFKNQEVIKKLNKEYFAVKFDVESNDTIVFGGITYSNINLNKPNPVHEIPLLLASRKSKPFSLPALILFNDKFIATDRYFQFLSSYQLKSILLE